MKIDTPASQTTQVKADKLKWRFHMTLKNNKIHMKIIFSFLIAAFACTFSYSQFSIGGGASLMKAFGVKSPYYGAHILGEFPVDESSSYYGRVGLYAKQTSQNFLMGASAIDPNTAPQAIDVNAKLSFSYITLEGGRRFYFGNGYDYGFAPYGGTHLMAIFNPVKLNTDNYDKSKYRLITPDTKGSVFNLAFGLSGGVKNDFSWGTLFFDVSFDYLILAQQSNEVAYNGFQQFGSQVLFTFGLGYRKSIF